MGFSKKESDKSGLDETGHNGMRDLMSNTMASDNVPRTNELATSRKSPSDKLVENNGSIYIISNFFLIVARCRDTPHIKKQIQRFESLRNE